jgi:hypothetical protein
MDYYSPEPFTAGKIAASGLSQMNVLRMYSGMSIVPDVCRKMEVKWLYVIMDYARRMF